MMTLQAEVESVARDLSVDPRVTAFWIDTNDGLWRLSIGVRSLKSSSAIMKMLPVALRTHTGFVQQTYSEEELATATVAAQRSLLAAGYAVDGSVDVRGETGVLTLEAGASATSASIARGTGPSVVIEIGEPSRPSGTYYAGQSMSTCTTGFTVVHSSGQRGVTTAGHCSPPEAGGEQYINGYIQLFKFQWFAGSADIQWHSTAGDTYRNWAYDGINDTSTPYYRLVTGTIARLSTVVGGTYCKYGKKTGYDCGKLNSRSESPGYVPNVTARYLGIDSTDGSVMSDKGDSGGPAFSGGKAIGIISGSGLSGYRAVVTSMDGFAGLPITIATS